MTKFIVEQPQPVGEIHIVQFTNGQIQFNWPKQNALLALSMLNATVRAILEEVAKTQQANQTKIVVPDIRVELRGNGQ